MTDATISKYIFGIIIFMFIVVGGLAFISGLGQTNPSMVQDPKFSEFNDSFNKMELVETKVSEIETNVNSTTPGDNPLNNLITGAWQTLRLIGTSFGFMDDVFRATSTMFGIPVWISRTITMLITVLIAFVIYGLIFQRNP